MKTKKDIFWVSYGDIMTGLFFIMLIMFGIYHAKVNATLEQYEKIKQIQKAIENIDSNYFEYNSKYKKHILKISVNFDGGSANIMDIDFSTRTKLINAGYTIKNFLNDKTVNNLKIQYLLIIEGQASNDKSKLNDDLSYHRAISLYKFWCKTVGNFRNFQNCELILAGSGIKGLPRIIPDIPPTNQRFLITIVPKIGSMKL